MACRQSTEASSWSGRGLYEELPLGAQGDTTKPAREAAAGHLSAVLDGDISAEYEESALANDAAAYAGALGAVEEAEKVRQREDASG